MADIERLQKNLTSHGFRTSFFQTKEEAADYLCASIHNSTVGFGGSKTLEDLGLYERLCIDNKVLWHWKQDATEAKKQAALANIYLSSVNGVSETGVLVNIDGGGNRLAGTLWGRDKVYFVVGVNKIAPDLEQAIWRARNIAAPMNAKRFAVDTPCVKSETMRCYDCNSKERICKGLLILWQKMDGIKECEVVIINKNLGF